MRFDNILQAIGNTPHVRLNRLYGETEVWMKLEKSNPGGSIKDRIGLSMIEAAEKAGKLVPGSVIVEPTSGNTGVGLALVCAVKGYRCILTMPDSMSVERRQLMLAYGAELELTDRKLGVKGAIKKAEEIVESLGGKGWMPFQFSNPDNVQVHVEQTAEEIKRAFPEGFDYLITGVGTGGHISGCAKVLKAAWPALKVFAVEPEKSPVLSGGQPGPHIIMGIGAGLVPDNYQAEFIDGVIQVKDEEALEMAQRCVREEGVFVGTSTGASLAATRKKLAEVGAGARVLTFNYDTGERYLSVAGFLQTSA